jgi:hypothetical protein
MLTVKSIVGTFCAVTISACSAAATSTRDGSQSSVAELRTTFTELDQRRVHYAKAPPEHQQACEVDVGDCRLTVNEKREKLIQNKGRVNCRMQDPDREARCIADEMLGREDLTLALEFYNADIWCHDQLLACIAKQETKAATDSVAARADQRRLSLEQSKEGIAERARGSFAAEKVKYIRATLPPDAEGDCEDVKTTDSCIESAREKESEYLKEFDKSESEYKFETAKRLLTNINQAEAACYKPEIDCLLARLPKYGETKDTTPSLEKNFALLEQRQRLYIKLGPAYAQHCLDEGTTVHQPEIIRSYLAYVREPVLFFRRQLHRAFLTMHQAQVDCLKSTPQ